MFKIKFRHLHKDKKLKMSVKFENYLFTTIFLTIGDVFCQFIVKNNLFFAPKCLKLLLCVKGFKRYCKNYLKRT